MERQGRTADLANTLGDCVGGGENLVGLLVKHQMVVAEMRARNMPMEILRLQVEVKHIRKQNVECAGEIAHGFRFQIRRSFEWSYAQCFGFSSVH